MAKKKTADVEEEYVYSWQRKDDLGEVRHDFDAIVSSDEPFQLTADGSQQTGQALD